MVFLLISLFLGVMVGVVSSLFGIGGGVFIVPLLPNLLGFSPHQAIATSLAAVFLVTFLNTIGFSQEKIVNWRTGLMLGIPSGVIAFFSGPWAAQAGDFFLRAFFLAILVVLLIITFLRRKMHVPDETPLPVSFQKKTLAGIFALVAGFVSAFTGIGAGVILSPIMFNLKMVRPRELVPTTNLSTMLTTFSGALSYALIDLRQGSELIHKPMAVSLFVVATVTAFWVRPYQGRLSQGTKITFLCFLLLFIISKQSYELYRLHF
jgi:uncharacterized protein